MWVSAASPPGCELVDVDQLYAALGVGYLRHGVEPIDQALSGVRRMALIVCVWSLWLSLSNTWKGD